jgi:TonB family protein
VQARLRLWLETTHHVVGTCPANPKQFSAIACSWTGRATDSKMNEIGRQWEGQIVVGEFKLGAYLGGSERAWVFATGREGQQAAIKLVCTDEKEAVEHLSRWAQTARLSHPHLLRLFETGRCRIGDTDLVYAVMERAEEALAEILPDRALAPTEAGQMLPPILDALAYLHSQGFAHGSMSPSNILAVGDQVKISSDRICSIGAPRRRPSVYDAPGGKCSAAADMWSLGITLAQALTQEVPRWQASSGEDPVILGPLPQPFLDVVSNCLRRDEQRRWTIREVRDRLQPSWQSRQLREVKPEAPREILPPRATANWRHMMPGIALIVLAVIMIFLAPKIRGRFQNRQPEAAATPAPLPTTKTSSASPPLAEAARSAKSSPADRSSGPAASPRAPVDAAAASDHSRAEPVPDEVREQVMPEVPQRARDTIRGTVKVQVRVQVGPSGDVTAVSIDSPGPSQYFANLAARAASQWRFAPAPDSGDAQRTWILRFEFTQDATKAFPVLRP